MSTPPIHVKDVAANPRWGNRLRQAREAQGISLRALSRQLEVSAGHMSQIERDIVAPSISLLYAITSALGVSMDSLFATSDRLEEPAPPDGVSDVPRTSGEERFVCRFAERRRIDASPGVRWELLTPSTDTRIDFREIVYATATEPPESFIRHDGHEYGLVLEGYLHIQVEFDVYALGPGDSITFDSARPHKFWNEGPGVARAVWVSNVTQ